MSAYRIVPAAIASLALAASLAACSSEAPEAEAGAETEAAATDAPETALTDEQIKEVLHERHELYEEMGDDFKAIRVQLEGGSPDMAAIAASAKAMSAKGVQIKDMFPAGTALEDGHKTEALKTIWEQPEKFEEARLALITKADALAAAAESGDGAAVGNAVKELGGSCKGCHDTFRKPEDD
ncbi:MAG: cytochrome c [Sphingomonadaceae bacterium]